MNQRPRIYLAGPTVFMHDARERGQALRETCEEAGCDAIYPGDVTAVGRGARGIFETCITGLSNAHAVVADLSPFRGPHVDDGTALELGFAVARGIPIFGYASDLRPLVERIERHPQAATLVDHAGLTIEDLGEPFNAMIAGALAVPAFATADEAIAAAAHALKVSRSRTDAEIRTAMVKMRHETFGTEPRPDDFVRQAAWAALNQVQYATMQTDALADHLATVLAERGVVSDENSYAGGLQTAIAGMESVRLPFWATIVRPAWFRDFEAILAGLQRSANMLGAPKAGGYVADTARTLFPPVPRRRKWPLWTSAGVILACAILAARTAGLFR